MNTIKTHLTRSDCTRDNVTVVCPGASLLGFGTRKAKRGAWIVYEVENYKHIGRVIGRVTCEGKVYIEAAVASQDFSSVYVRWIEPHAVREIRRVPPRAVFEFLGMDAGDWIPQNIYKHLEDGVSDLRDQLAEVAS